MERCSAYVIVSEGSSERAYIQQLRSLANLSRHIADPRMVALFRANTPTDTFAEFLVSKLRSLYPASFTEK